MWITIRKSLNTNGNTEGIFPSVNFWGILPTNIFPRYISMELHLEKKIKQRKQKMITCQFLLTELPKEKIPSVKSIGKFVGKLWTLFIMLITKGITDRIFRRYFSESSRTVHFPIALLIVLLYGQNHQRIEKSSVLFDGFLKIFN